MIVYTAPIPISLFGGFTTSFSLPSLSCATDYRVSCTIMNSPKNNKIEDVPVEKALHRAVEAHLRTYPKRYDTRPHLHFEFPDIMFGDQLVAQLVCGTAALLMYYTGTEPHISQVAQVAFAAEKVLRTYPTGHLLSTSCYGGLVYYRQETPFLKHLSSLTLRLPRALEQSLFFLSSPRSSEITIEERLGKRLNQYPKATRRRFCTLERITRRALMSIHTENAPLFADCIRKTQEEYAHLGIQKRFSGVGQMLVDQTADVDVFLCNAQSYEAYQLKSQAIMEQTVLFRQSTKGVIEKSAKKRQIRRFQK